MHLLRGLKLKNTECQVWKGLWDPGTVLWQILVMYFLMNPHSKKKGLLTLLFADAKTEAQSKYQWCFQASYHHAFTFPLSYSENLTPIKTKDYSISSPPPPWHFK